MARSIIENTTPKIEKNHPKILKIFGDENGINFFIILSSQDQ